MINCVSVVNLDVFKWDVPREKSTIKTDNLMNAASHLIHQYYKTKNKRVYYTRLIKRNI